MYEIGTWTRCPNPSMTRVTHFWKKFPDYKYSFCDLCLYEVKVRNGTLPITNSFKTLKNPDCKPEKDSL